MTRKFLIISFSALSSLWVNAQSETEQQDQGQQEPQRTSQRSLQAPSEQKQYPATLEGKFVKKESLYTYKNILLDSVKAHKSLLQEKLNTIQTQSSQINELNTNIAQLQEALDKEKNRNDSMDFFGLTIEKGVYSIIVWGIIILLGISLVVFVSRYARSNSITRGALKDFEDLQNEYEEYRSKAIEREQKVRRQLQDEINKHRS